MGNHFYIIIIIAKQDMWWIWRKKSKRLVGNDLVTLLFTQLTTKDAILVPCLLDSLNHALNEQMNIMGKSSVHILFYPWFMLFPLAQLM